MPIALAAAVDHDRVEFSSFRFWLEQADIVRTAEHLGRLERRRMARVRVCTRIGEYGDDVVDALEYRARQRGLAFVVGPIYIGAALDQSLHRAGVPVIGRQHQEGVAVLIRHVHRHTSIDVLRQRAGIAAAGHREQPIREIFDVFAHRLSNYAALAADKQA